jgi:hypothetical protein
MTRNEENSNDDLVAKEAPVLPQRDCRAGIPDCAGRETGDEVPLTTMLGRDESEDEAAKCGFPGEPALPIATSLIDTDVLKSVLPLSFSSVPL